MDKDAMGLAMEWALGELGELKGKVDPRWADLIRMTDGRCPLCALAHLRDPNFRPRAHWPSAAEALHMPLDVARRIANAADSPAHNDRLRLLAALGVA
jgi:hypothetical protein